MTDRVRALFFASLALIAGELVLWGGASTAVIDEAAAPVVEPVQVHHEPHPTGSYGARNWLPGGSADKRAHPAADAPVAPSQPTSRTLPAVDDQAVVPSPFAPSADALLLLPPSRAPPALS